MNVAEIHTHRQNTYMHRNKNINKSLKIYTVGNYQRIKTLKGLQTNKQTMSLEKLTWKLCPLLVGDLSRVAGKSQLY